MFQIDFTSNKNLIEKEALIADDMAYRYDLFLGDIILKNENFKIDLSWGWIPLLDFAHSFFLICNDLSTKNDSVEEFEFTDSGAVILIQKSGETELSTLSQKKPFLFRFDNYHQSVEIIPNSKDPRSIPKTQFQKVWMIAKNSTTPFSPSQYTTMTYHSSYIVAIMKYFLQNEKIE